VTRQAFTIANLLWHVHLAQALYRWVVLKYSARRLARSTTEASIGCAGPSHLGDPGRAYLTRLSHKQHVNVTDTAGARAEPLSD
jgi:hypothetical protein